MPSLGAVIVSLAGQERARIWREIPGLGYSAAAQGIRRFWSQLPKDPRVFDADFLPECQRSSSDPIASRLLASLLLESGSTPHAMGATISFAGGLESVAAGEDGVHDDGGTHLGFICPVHRRAVDGLAPAVGFVGRVVPNRMH